MENRMEHMDALHNPFKDKTILVTGHTGFKGPWLSEWLLLMGAKVAGIGLEPVGDSPLFNLLGCQPR